MSSSESSAPPAASSTAADDEFAYDLENDDVIEAAAVSDFAGSLPADTNHSTAAPSTVLATPSLPVEAPPSTQSKSGSAVSTSAAVAHILGRGAGDALASVQASISKAVEDDRQKAAKELEARVMASIAARKEAEAAGSKQLEGNGGGGGEASFKSASGSTTITEASVLTSDSSKSVELSSLREVDEEDEEEEADDKVALAKANNKPAAATVGVNVVPTAASSSAAASGSASSSSTTITASLEKSVGSDDKTSLLSSAPSPPITGSTAEAAAAADEDLDLAFEREAAREAAVLSASSSSSSSSSSLSSSNTSAFSSTTSDQGIFDTTAAFASPDATYEALSSILLDPSRLAPHLKDITPTAPLVEVYETGRGGGGGGVSFWSLCCPCLTRSSAAATATRPIPPPLHHERDSIFALARCAYDGRDRSHAGLFPALYKCLLGVDFSVGVGGGDWTQIGFQREADFSTDLRGGGMLAPLQAYWFILMCGRAGGSSHQNIAQRLFQHSQHPLRPFPYMLQCISITGRCCLPALRMGRLGPLVALLADFQTYQASGVGAPAAAPSSAASFPALHKFFLLTEGKKGGGGRRECKGARNPATSIASSSAAGRRSGVVMLAFNFYFGALMLAFCEAWEGEPSASIASLSRIMMTVEALVNKDIKKAVEKFCSAVFIET